MIVPPHSLAMLRRKAARLTAALGDFTQKHRNSVEFFEPDDDRVSRLPM